MKASLTPDYLIGFIGLQIILHLFAPVSILISFPITLLGIPLVILGLYPNIIWVPDTFKKAETTTRPQEVPSALIAHGLFRLTRNPTYMGMALTLLGVAVLLGSLSPLAIPVLFIILTDRFTIPIEERNLEKQFGERYRSYKKKVRRWI